MWRSSASPNNAPTIARLLLEGGSPPNGQALLRYIGGNANTYAMAGLFGDVLALRLVFAGVDSSRPSDVRDAPSRPPVV